MHRQMELEMEMAGLGRERYLSRVRKDIDKERGHDTKTGRHILEASIGPVTEGLKAFIEDAYSGRPGPRAVAARLVKDMDHEAVAYLACRAILSRMMKPRSPTLLTLAVAVARAVELEARFTEFKAREPERFKWKLKELSDNGSDERHKAAVLVFDMSKQGVAWDRWSRTDMQHLGIKLIELFCAHTGLAEIMQAHDGGDKDAPRDQYLVNLTPRASAWIDQSVRGGELLSPEYMPTVVPPKDWSGLTGGGYHTALARPVPLVRRARGPQLELLKRADLSLVFKGLNGIQRTAWRINPRVLEVMQHLAVASGDGVAGLVPADDLPMPVRPVDIDTNPQSLREWKWGARDVYSANLQLRQDRLKQQHLLGLADKFREAPSIYFPHNLDFRGRGYPVPDVLNPQGSDAAKGLLMFAEGKPLGADGERWLAIHGANSFGVDKVSFKAREAWVYKHAGRIRQCAEDPLGDLWWTEADSPWCFLAFCFEFDRMRANALTFVNHIAIAQDGSCNGLQHFSAMLLDSVGGAAVNLITSEDDEPQDIYQVVADRVMAQLRLIASTDGTIPEAGKSKKDGPTQAELQRWAHEWLTMGIDRKVTKRPVMVLPYGGTPRSCLKYVDEAVRAKIAGGYRHNLGDELKRAIGFLSSLVWDSIGDVVIAARDAMGWLQKTARAFGKDGLALHWTTPSGFVGYQGYVDMKSRRIDTKIAGSLVRLRTYEETDKIDAAKQATSISPNYVHSMDATAMILTVAHLVDDGIDAFAMIHDSYGTHACNSTALARKLREVFVWMYQDDPLTAFRDEALKANPSIDPERIEELPSKGTLDLSSVLQSKYFFA